MLWCFTLVLSLGLPLYAVTTLSAEDTLAARGRLRSADAMFARAAFDSAVFEYRSAAALFGQASPLDAVQANIGEANALLRTGEYRKVAELLLRAHRVGRMAQYTGSWQHGRVLTLLSYCLNTLERSDSALICAYEAVPILQHSLGDRHPLTAAALYMLATVEKALGQYPASILHFEQALDRQRSEQPMNVLMVANTVAMLGTMYDDINEYDKAIAYLLKADSLYGLAGKAGAEPQGWSYLYLTSSYNNRGDYHTALQWGERTLERYASIGQMHASTVGSVLAKMGEVFLNLGDVENARDHFRRSLSVYAEHHPEKRSAIGMCNLWLAEVARRSGDISDAVQQVEIALPMYMKARGATHPQLATLYSVAASIYLSAGRFDQAKHYYLCALTSRSKVKESRSRSDIAGIHSALGEVFLRQGKKDSAFVHLSMALAIDTASTDVIVPQRAELHRRFGDYFRSVRRWDDALTQYQNAALLLTAGGDAGNDEVRSRSIYKKELLQLFQSEADVLESKATGRNEITSLQRSLERTSQAVELLDALRKGYRLDGSKLLLVSRTAELFASATRRAMVLYQRTQDRSYAERAFVIADRGKASVMLDRLFDNDARHIAGIPDSLLQLEQKRISAIARMEVQLASMEKDPHSTDRDVRAKEREEYFGLLRDQQEFADAMEREFPRYFELKYDTRGTTVAMVQQNMADGAAMVEFQQSGDRLYAFVITRKAFAVREIAGAGRVNALVRECAAALKTYDSPVFYRTGDKLYRTLFRPLEPLLAGITELKVVPDASLHQFPLEALPLPGRTEERRFLISRYEIVYAYSASFYHKLVSEGKGAGALSVAAFAPVFRDSAKNADFLANRDAVVRSGIDAVRSITADGRSFNELRYSEKEVDDIARTMTRPDVPVRTFLFTDASEENFKANASRYDILHIATHGYNNAKDPRFSAVLFSQPSSPSSPEDGILYLNETYSLDLKASLVVLSSCESGVGTMVAGEGMIALSRGLFYAGARNIVVSLWKVPDRQTCELMGEFYRNIAAGRSYAAALRAAKLTMAAAPGTAFPAKWSGFVLMGR